MAEPVPALVALGSNMSFGGVAPADVVAAAMKDVGALGCGAATSRLWRSPAWPPGGPDYVNAAMRLETDLPPEALLAALHAIEERWGRERSTRWGARTLDLDLIDHDGRRREGARRLRVGGLRALLLGAPARPRDDRLGRGLRAHLLFGGPACLRDDRLGRGLRAHLLFGGPACLRDDRLRRGLRALLLLLRGVVAGDESQRG